VCGAVSHPRQVFQEAEKGCFFEFFPILSPDSVFGVRFFAVFGVV